ncbi:MAG: transcription-repair coupling factor, partial [Opitutaceae bacterium]|nr:transcription-repair coupling factor [Opitutaceae bacterium]
MPPPSLPRHKHTGVCPPARGAVIAALVRAQPAPVWLVVTENLRAAEQLAEDIAFFHAAAEGSAPLRALVFPESTPDGADMREAFATSSDRLTVLSHLRATRGLGRTPDTLVVTTTPAALLQSVPALEEFATREITLTRGQAQPFQGLIEALHALDYDSEAVCEAPGHYAVRGGIIDVYPVTTTQPYRLDFFGDEIESIREFDPVTQRSGAAVESVSLAASPRVRLGVSQTGLADYLSPGTHLLCVEPAALDGEFSALARAAHDAFAPLLARCAAAFGMSDLDEASWLFDEATTEATWDTESLAHHRRYPDDALVAQERLSVEEDARHEFLRQIATWRKAGYDLVIVSAKEGEEQRAQEILAEHPDLKGLQPRWLRGGMNEGFRITFREGADSDLMWAGVGRPPPVIKHGWGRPPQKKNQSPPGRKADTQSRAP